MWKMNGNQWMESFILQYNFFFSEKILEHLDCFVFKTTNIQGIFFCLVDSHCLVCLVWIRSLWTEQYTLYGQTFCHYYGKKKWWQSDCGTSHTHPSSSLFTLICHLFPHYTIKNDNNDNKKRNNKNISQLRIESLKNFLFLLLFFCWIMKNKLDFYSIKDNYLKK